MDEIILNLNLERGGNLIRGLENYLFYDEFRALHLCTHENAGLTSIQAEYNTPLTGEENDIAHAKYKDKIGHRQFRTSEFDDEKSFALRMKKNLYLSGFKTFFVGNITMNPRNLQFLEKINSQAFRFDTVNVQFLPAVCGTPTILRFTPPVANMTFVLDTDFTLFLKGVSNNNTPNVGDCALLIDITRLRRLEIQGRIGKFRFNVDAHEHIERPQFEKVFTATYPGDHESLEMVRLFDPNHIVEGVLAGTSISKLPLDILNMVSSHLVDDDVHHSWDEANIKFPPGTEKKKRGQILRKHRTTVAKKKDDKQRSIQNLADFKENSENSERMKSMKASAKSAKGVTRKRRSKKTKKRNSLYRKGLFKNLRRN